jgi:hypothetical protein
VQELTLLGDEDRLKVNKLLRGLDANAKDKSRGTPCQYSLKLKLINIRNMPILG